MRRMKWGLPLFVTVLAVVPALLIGRATPAGGQVTAPAGVQGDICPVLTEDVTVGGTTIPAGTAGIIPSTLPIVGNTRLTCDVQCLQLDNGPCIRFDAPGIKLDLNRFKMTGTANEPPRANCITGANFPVQQADGIQSTFDDVVIEGPGVVQRMRRHGIALLGSPPTNPTVDKSVIKKLVSHLNCFSGIFLGGADNTLIEEVVSVKNSSNSEWRPCGGICITGSNFNRVRRSEFAGNGSAALSGEPASAPVIPPGPGIPNDFGVGLVGSSNFNIVEENGMGGNINGLALFPIGAMIPTNNLIRKNVIVGNPPIEISADNPAINPVGSDIRDFAGTTLPSGAPTNNRFEDNLCMTYTFGPSATAVSPPPCAGSQHEPARMFEQKLPQYAGHQNN